MAIAGLYLSSACAMLSLVSSTFASILRLISRICPSCCLSTMLSLRLLCLTCDMSALSKASPAYPSGSLPDRSAALRASPP
eukprot:CAMPEP_0169482064 /NCGR_PEP_ID=MMETSP1042-20121227/30474_1 /TAXON_ID=464988 /ORGANISM="Hemiselmis andersenii, Strain CCMP1180" /LENGTH=80 /DNA_ID=CAMNT_0009596903 /DNA_START=233 /DNA_END=475 /DNA_ORIENTATION=-